MKRVIVLLLCLLWSGNLWATNIRPSDQVTIPTRTIYNDGNLAAPDSVRIQVFRNGAEQSDAWYNNADAEAATIDGWLIFHDQLQDIDGAGGDGHYAILGRAYDLDSTHYTPWVYSFTVGPWTAIDLIEDSIQSQDDWVAKEATLAYFDTLIYVGPRGPGVYLDSAAGNTNTVIGADGTSKNPVSTIAAAKTIATALGYNRYYFLNASTFNDAANDLPSSHQNWEFIGIGNSNALAFGTQRVDESRFENMDLSGTMHASGGNVLYTNCTLGYITANFNGHAFNCLLADTIVVKADVDIEFVRCQSDVGGNRTPTIDLSGGSSVVQMRAYSGGIRIMNGASNDTMSIETIGQLIISANNTSTNITVRGMLSITDSGTTTNLTKDAVFSRSEADLWIWANADTAQPDSSELGVWLVNNLGGGASSNWSDAQRDSVLRNMEDRALSLAKFDSTVVALLTGGIWLDAAAANTNTTVGIDGTITNPVSTLAAARILADSQSLQQYYLINNSSFTLDATYENWTFLGIGRGNSINFGSQDTDNSDFYNLMITGTQGGTGVVLLDLCYLNTPDSLEALVTRSSLSDTISLRVSTATVFDQCYSNIAGNATPGLDFNSAGTIEVLFRHYSGGITFFNGISTHTVSIEADGQFIIDASCTSLNVTGRGNMSVTDNGTTSNKTIDAVYNRTYTADVNVTEWVGTAPANVVNVGGQNLLEVNVQAFSENTTSADNLEEILNDDATGADVRIDSAAFNVVTIINSGSDPGLTIKSATGDAVYFQSSGGTGKAALYLDADGTSGIGLRADGVTDGIKSVGGTLDLNLTLNLDDVVGDLGATAFEDSFITEPKLKGKLFIAQKFNTNAFTDDVFAPDAFDGEDFTDAYWDSIAARSDSGAAGGTGLDSATTSRIVGRKTWGIAAGSGDDSSTIAQRRVGWVDTTNYALNVPGAGVGSQPETVYVYDTGNSVTVPNIPIQARNSSGTNLGQVTTNSEGYGVLNQDDAATIYVRISGSSGYTAANNPETISVATPYRDTVYVTAFSATAPVGDLTTLYNWIVDGNDQGIKNVVVEAYIPNKFWPVTNANKAINARHSTKTDSVGLWELQIFGNDIVLTDQGDSSSYWMVTAEDGSFKHKVTVSSDSTQQLMVPDE